MSNKQQVKGTLALAARSVVGSDKADKLVKGALASLSTDELALVTGGLSRLVRNEVVL